MLTRRRFLGCAGTGMLALSSDCKPPLLDRLSSASGPLAVLGYPANLNTPPEEFFVWRRQLREAGIGRFAYNNVGNPYTEGPVAYNTHDFERELILRFGGLFKFPADNTWGFLSHSGTDSNMHGMYMGRTLLKGRTGLLPKAYFTREAHYSVQILRDLLGLETVLVDTLPDGGMDPEDLGIKLALHSSQPALVVATVGTTFKGAIDPIDRIQAALKGHPSYLHLDAALFGCYLPFSRYSGAVSYLSDGVPVQPRYDSIAVSCHKFFGFPSPAGLFVTTASHFDEFNGLFGQIHNPEYMHHVPGTITCSRDAVKPAEFYYFSTPAARDKLAEDARLMLENTAYLMNEMQTQLPRWQPARMTELSNTVFFRKPSDLLVKKYSLATMHLETNRHSREYAHVVLMPHAGRKVLDQFLADLEGDPVNRA